MGDDSCFGHAGLHFVKRQRSAQTKFSVVHKDGEPSVEPPLTDLADALLTNSSRCICTKSNRVFEKAIQRSKEHASECEQCWFLLSCS